MEKAHPEKVTEQCNSAPFLFSQLQGVNLLPLFNAILLETKIIDKSIYRLGKIIITKLKASNGERTSLRDSARWSMTHVEPHLTIMSRRSCTGLNPFRI